MNSTYSLRLFTYFCSFILFNQAAIGQNYIATDSSLVYGTIKLSTPKDNLYTVQFRENKLIPFRRYHPNDIREYGFNGKTFFAKEVEIEGQKKKVFIERLVDGTIKLYHLKGDGPRRFYVEKNDDDFQPLKKDLKAIRSICENCEVIEEGLQLAKFNRRALWHLVTAHNLELSRPFPRMRFGLFAGLSSRNLTIKGSQLATLQLSQNSNDQVFDTHTGVDFGVLVDMPFKNPRLSFNTGVIFQGGNFESTIPSFLVRSEVDIQLRTFSVPLLIRYTLPIGRFRPYVNSGIQYSLQNTKTSKNNRTVFTPTPDDPFTLIPTSSVQERRFVSANMIGLVIGAGTEIDIPGYRDLFIEYRLTGLTGADPATRMRYSLLAVGVNL